jgi:hypothetical protein
MRAFTADFRQALRIVWLAISLVILAALAAPFVLGGERLAHLLPPCEWKLKYRRECPFCGMTTSFMDISEGQFGNAQRANHAGVPTYLLFVTNEIAVLALVRRKGSTICKR